MTWFHDSPLALLEEAAAEMRPVDLGMAVDTDFRGEEKITLVTLAVALDTDTPDIPVGQQETVGGAVGIVANATAFEFHRRMLKDPRASLFGVAFETDIDVELVPAAQTRPGAGPMRGVAVGATHGSFQHLVPGWKRELEPDFPMARKAEVGLRRLEEFRQRGAPVHSMAVIAGHSLQLVSTPLKLEKFLFFLVTFEADV